ncbi:TIGR00341 family protein [Natrialbaceae archaeon AArc-T1-2]|uniref:TIGR00341 family protein n=1 Tax=Natrialbaceae archaeon AArc-T1-2 TaxID=3053904 RepID=UPI00255B3D0C|nr:TIGR00341 family protein [Natrialbaceae archaeon AArc-T1-2]WIV66780.1 TIGR00341 family protein [Natrialbaceae archaeon AArc-T1-2]
MRYVEILIPAGRRADVLEVLDDEGIHYVVSDTVGGQRYTAAVRFPLSGEAVETVLDRLGEVEIGSDANVAVIDAEKIALDDRSPLDVASERGERIERGGERLSRQELQARAAGLTPSFPVYATMTLISALVATAGLLLDSPAVVVGSMVIAPLIGPALAASVGTVVADAELRSTGLSYQLSGLAIAVLGSIALAGLTRMTGLEPGVIDLVGVAELEERVAPNLLSLVIALGAGVAGVLSLTRELSEAIVGVMIAAALIPPAAAAGIAVAWEMYGAAIGATVLMLVNTFSINLAALLTLWAGEYRPPGLFDVPRARKQALTFAAILGTIMVVLLVPLAGATLAELEATQLESDATTEVEGVLADPAYDGLEAESVTVEFDDDYPVRSIEEVVVTITGPDAEPEPGLTERLVAAIEPHAEDQVSIEVRFVVAEHATVADDEHAHDARYRV